MKKVLAFDLDGTLAPSKSVMSDEMNTEFARLLGDYELAIITGGGFDQFESRILNRLDASDDKLKHLHLFPTCGTQYYRFDSEWKQMYAENLSDDDKYVIISALEKGIDELGLREATTYGKTIEDRGSQVTFSALGQDVVTELGDEGLALKEAWDPLGEKKEKLRSYLVTQIPQFEIRAGGMTSIDITQPGINKAYGIRKLMEILGVSKEDILFFGDKMQPGGNDYPVKEYGVESREVANPEETLADLKTYK